MKAKCSDCQIRPVTEHILCAPCNEYAEWENTHSDYAHDTLNEDSALDLANSNYTSQEELDAWIKAERELMIMCPVCNPDLDPRNAPVRQGHTQGIAKTYSSHAACKHARTPKDRAECRKARDLGKA